MAATKTRRRFTYVGTFLGHVNSHRTTKRRLGYQWFVIDRAQREDPRSWLPYKVVQHCFTRREARLVARELNEIGLDTFKALKTVTLTDMRYTHGKKAAS